MSMKIGIFVLIVFTFTGEVHNRPALKTGLLECYTEKCPENAVACQKKSEVSEDRKNILSTISCLDIHDNVLRSVNRTEKNPFGENTYFQGYSFSGTYDFTDDDLNNSTPAKLPNSETKEESPKSEVEDLNTY